MQAQDQDDILKNILIKHSLSTVRSRPALEIFSNYPEHIQSRAHIFEDWAKFIIDASDKEFHSKSVPSLLQKIPECLLRTYENAFLAPVLASRLIRTKKAEELYHEEFLEFLDTIWEMNLRPGEAWMASVINFILSIE